MPRTRIIIADDHPIVLHAFADSLSQWYDVAARLTSLNGLADAVRTLSPDVVLLDLAFGDHTSLSKIPMLLGASRGVRVIIVTAHAEPLLADAAFEAGAMGYVLKSSQIHELHAAISEVMCGREYRSDLTSGFSAAAVANTVHVQFTSREQRMLVLLAEGMTQREVGIQVGLSPNGVEKVLARLRSSLGLRRTSQLVHWFQGGGAGV